MSTRTTVEDYFAALRAGDAWSDRLVPTMTLPTTPRRDVP